MKHLFATLLAITLCVAPTVEAKKFSMPGKSLGKKLISPIKNLNKSKAKKAEKVSLDQILERSKTAKDKEMQVVESDLKWAESILDELSQAKTIDEIKQKKDVIDSCVKKLIPHLLKKHDPEIANKLKENLANLLAVQEGLRTNSLTVGSEKK